MMESTNNSTRMQLVTTETQVGSLEKENTNLRRDKDILTDHVADLQRQVRKCGLHKFSIRAIYDLAHYECHMTFEYQNQGLTSLCARTHNKIVACLYI